MQKGDLKKLTLLTSGVGARMEQNSAYFVALTMGFQSGKKRFDAEVQYQEDGWFLRFQGTGQRLSAQEVCAFFVKQAQQFEEAVLTYTERGKQMVITCTARGVQMKQSEQPAAPATDVLNPLLDTGRQYWIRADKAAPLLREIGIMTASGKLKNDKIRKYNQIDHYVELVAPMFEKENELVLLDCACGKSYLSFVLNYYLCEVLGRRCRVIGIDCNEHVIQESRNMAERLGYRNMQFLTADLRTFIPPEPVTAVISLHACDTATDLALGVAIRARAKYIACVPCCHKELLTQFQTPGLEPLLRHGILKARFNDVLTDSLRALKLEAEGYQVSVVEYISPLDTPKNLLIRAVRTGQEREGARQEYEQVRALLGTTSTLDQQCEPAKADFFIADEDLL